MSAFKGAAIDGRPYEVDMYVESTEGRLYPDDDREALGGDCMGFIVEVGPGRFSQGKHYRADMISFPVSFPRAEWREYLDEEYASADLVRDALIDAEVPGAEDMSDESLIEYGTLQGLYVYDMGRDGNGMTEIKAHEWVAPQRFGTLSDAQNRCAEQVRTVAGDVRVIIARLIPRG